MSEGYSSDNSGNRICDPNCVDPVAASGITVAMATAGTDYTGTVEAGERYVVAADGGFCLLSTTGVTSTEANREWTVADKEKIIIRVPFGKTTLYCESDTNTTTLYLAKLA